jgi:putative flavoprotein involved in K+ transport
MIEHIETVIIGGGQAGLAMSYHLRRLGCEHVMLERLRVAERWRSERWDGLIFQSPNWNIHLPGFAFAGEAEAFASRDDLVRFIEGYAALIRPPLRCGVTVTALGQKPGSTRLLVEAESGDRIETNNVVIATGPYHRPAEPLPIAPSILQMHSSRYRNPDALPPGAVLVIGSGNAGTQIADELNRAGREVYLSVSSHSRAPRRYRGRDYIWWHKILGDTDKTVDQRQVGRPTSLLSGLAGGHEVDLRQLANAGVTLLGRVLGEHNNTLSIAADLRDKLDRGDASLAAFLRRAEDYAGRNQLSLPPPEQREALPEPKDVVDPILSLDIAGISSIIWANGFRYDFDWVNLPIFAEGAHSSMRIPVHKRGVTAAPGVYVLGLKWLYSFKSALLHGVGEDAEYLAEQIAGRRHQSA